MAYLADDLLIAIKRDSFLPTVQGNWTDPQMLAVGDEQLLDTMVPMLLGLDAGWFREYADTTLVTDQAEYTFPQYAMFGKFFRIALVDSVGNYFDLQRTDPSMLQTLQLSSSTTPRLVYLNGDQIVLSPAPDSTSASNYVLRSWIYRRPGRMVAASAAAIVSSVNTGTGVVTYTASKPGTFTSSSTHDFYSGTSPFHRRYARIVATASGSATTHTFPVATLPVAGDYVCVVDETVYPALPIELHSHLKDLIIASMARTQMDREQYETVKGKILERARTAVTSAPAEQIVSQPRKLSLWGHGLLSMGNSAGRRTVP